jgi:CBS domain containing-hemolysin-like protein
LDDSESFFLDFSILSQIGNIPTNDWLIIIGLLSSMLILLGISAFISASEISFFSLVKNDIIEIESENEFKAKQIKGLLDNPDRLLATILIVNNTVNIGLVLLSTNLFDEIAEILEPVFNIGLLTISQVVLITIFLLLFGEIIPKVYATQKKKSLAKIMIGPIRLCDKIFYLPSKALVTVSKIFDKSDRNKNKNLSVDELSEVHEIVQNKANKQEQKNAK